MSWRTSRSCLNQAVPVECWQPIVQCQRPAMDYRPHRHCRRVPRPGANEQVVHAYRDALARHGRETELGTDLIIGFSFHIAETEQKAIEEARRISRKI